MKKNCVHASLMHAVHPEWACVVEHALSTMDQAYLASLQTCQGYLPAYASILNAFQTPRRHVRYILLGESPYPREDSANGYAFWDGRVGSLWGDRGLSVEVNRATSLRNLIKMLLYARGDLKENYSIEAMKGLDTTEYCQTASELFHNFLDAGFLLLNASLIYEPGRVAYHAKMWRPFLKTLLQDKGFHSSCVLLLWGRIAEKIAAMTSMKCLISEHPYQLSFITHPVMVDFFKPLNVLSRYAYSTKHNTDV